jgi:dsRNA-specific ribonuclease
MYKYCLYKRFPKENEGFMTEKKIALVKNESIGRMAYEMGCTTGLSYPNTQRRSRPGSTSKTGVSVRGVSGPCFWISIR